MPRRVHAYHAGSVVGVRLGAARHDNQIILLLQIGNNGCNGTEPEIRAGLGAVRLSSREVEQVGVHQVVPIPDTYITPVLPRGRVWACKLSSPSPEFWLDIANMLRDRDFV